jgi:hypothetical protein
MREKLVATFEDAAGGARSTTRAVGLMRYFLRLRFRLDETLETFRRQRSLDDDEAILREAQRAFLRQRQLFHEAATRTDLVRAWNDLLVDAAAKVAADRSDAELYRDDAASSDASDRDWYAGARSAAARRWTDD